MSVEHTLTLLMKPVSWMRSIGRDCVSAHLQMIVAWVSPCCALLQRSLSHKEGARPGCRWTGRSMKACEGKHPSPILIIMMMINI